MMFGRPVQTTLPMLDTAFKQVPQKVIEAAQKIKNDKLVRSKEIYDRTAKDLPELEVGRKVRIMNERTRKWDRKGEIVYKDEKTKRSYRIKTKDGSLIFRNRVFIKPIRFHSNEKNKSLDLHTKTFTAGMLGPPPSPISV